MDGFRMSDGSDVVIKHIKDNKNEVDIARYLASEALRDDIHNHTVPILDIITLDSGNSDAVLLVMPQLQPFHQVPFETTEQMVDFIRQALEVMYLQLLSSCQLHIHLATFPRDSLSCTITASHMGWVQVHSALFYGLLRCPRNRWPSLRYFLMDGARFFPEGYGIQLMDSTPMQLVRRHEDTRSRLLGGLVKYYWVNCHQSKRCDGENRSETGSDSFARDVCLLGTSMKVLLTDVCFGLYPTSSIHGNRALLSDTMCYSFLTLLLVR
jgi:hypothetical protein